MNRKWLGPIIIGLLLALLALFDALHARSGGQGVPNPMPATVISSTSSTGVIATPVDGP